MREKSHLSIPQRLLCAGAATGLVGTLTGKMTSTVVRDGGHPEQNETRTLYMKRTVIIKKKKKKAKN